MSIVLAILPSYNERENVIRLAEKILSLYKDTDVLVVDDNSPDGTQETVREAQPQWNGRLNLLVREQKSGRGSAVLAGFAYALKHDYQLIFEMDGDCSHNPEEMAQFREKMTEADIVIGSRYGRGGSITGWNWKRKLNSKVANIIERLFLHMPVTEYTNGYRCYSRRALEALDTSQIRARGFIVLTEIAYQLYRKGFKIAEVPSRFVNRQRGHSNLSFKEIREALKTTIRLRFTKFTTTAS